MLPPRWCPRDRNLWCWSRPFQILRHRPEVSALSVTQLLLAGDRLPFRYWEPSQESCPNAHVTDRGGLAHGVTVFNSDQSQASTGNSEQLQASMRNSDQSQPFVGNMKEI